MTAPVMMSIKKQFFFNIREEVGSFIIMYHTEV